MFPEQVNKSVYLFVCDPVNNLTVIPDQLNDHLRHVQANVSLQKVRNGTIYYCFSCMYMYDGLTPQNITVPKDI